MTLRDKIVSIIWGMDPLEVVNDLEKIADDYAVKFGEWLRVEAYDAGDSWVYIQDNQDYTTEELRKIFKKEKGL
jgi:hypothetical protein